MAIIGDIRRKGGFLIAIFVGTALLAFILGDFLGPGGSLSSTSQFEIGEVAGEIIPAREFDSKVQNAIENYKEQSGSASIDVATTDLLRDQTWIQWLSEIIMGAEYDYVGVTVHPDEIFDLVTGANPHPIVVQAFSNPETGAFSAGDVISFLKNMDNDPSGKSRAQWIPLEQTIKKDQLSLKYFSLIKKGLYITRREAQRDYEAFNSSIKIKYAVQRYNDVPDSIVTLEESDIKKYYEEHKKEHEQKASRSLEYISFDVFPSTDDSLLIEDWINRKTEELADVYGLEDIKSFVNMNADTRFTDVFVKQGMLSIELDSIMFDSNSDSTTMVGPYIEEDSYKLAKLVDVEMRPDSVKARHILVAIKVSDDTTHITKADSILDLLDNGADFALLATTLSDDPGSKEGGGELGWFAEGTMVKAFNDSCFSGSVGDIVLVETQFGIHIIEILELTEPIEKVKIGTIDRRIEPSSKTFAKIYAEANKFAGSNKSVESFEKSATEIGKVYREAQDLLEGDKAIIGLESPREVIRWAYKAEPGMVSGPFELGNKFVVAVLTSIKEEGYATLEDIRTEMEIDARKEKKANYVKAKIAENDDQNVDDLAYNLSANNEEFDLQVETAQNITFSSFNLAGIGREPKLIGQIYGSKKGIMSAPLKGNTGVFVFVIEEYNAAPAVEDLTASQSRLGSNVQARVEYEVFNALKKNANIVDNRYKFY